MKNLLIKQKTDIKLNESMEQSQNGGLTFKGPFTICSTADHKITNRNNRIYMEQEVLRHLGYLREKIKNDGSILGELDHPEGRFDTNLKCVSHKITDLWYDQQQHVVMGKLQLLDTPNGKIVKTLVESGYPLYVSSRAAGGVDERTKEVTIDQIFTYDIVCTPGFAEARLDMVNESANPVAYKYLNESVDRFNKDVNKAKSYGLDEGVTYVKELEHEFVLNEKDKELMKRCTVNIDDLSKPLFENDEEDKKNGVTPQMKQPKQIDNKDAAENAGLPTLSLDPSDPENQVEEVKEDGVEDATEKDKKKSEILSIDTESEDKKEESSKKRDLILDIQKEEKIEDDKDKDDDKKEDKESDDSDETILDADEDSDDEDDKESDVDEDEESDVAKEEAEKAEELAKDTKDTLSDIEDLLKSVEDNKKKEEKKKEVEEAIHTAYPFTISLSPNNFSRFARLNPEDKRKCNDFIVENQIFDVKQINEMWNIVLDNEDKVQQKNWLKLAEKEDIDLFLAADYETQNAIEETAKYCILETKADVDEFWARQGLRQRKSASIMNEEWNNKYNRNTLFNSDRNDYAYSQSYIDMISEMMDFE